jgi:hypothetical protein
MASKYDISALTLQAKEQEDVNKAVFERTITGGKLADSHEIETGVSMKTQIVFVGNLAEVGVAISGCGFTDGGQAMPLTEKFWEPVLVGGRLVHCANDVNNLFKLFERARKVSPDYFDASDSEALGMVIVALEKALERMLNRLVWFGDKQAKDIAGGGVYKNGTNMSLYTPFNGLFKQLFTEIPAGSKNNVVITQNAGANYAAQMLPAGAGLDYLRKMYKAQSPLMHQAKQDGATLKFYLTRELAENYEDTLEDKSLLFQLTTAEQGSTSLSYRGIPIEIRDDWSAYISLQDNGTKVNLPHRGVLTFKENIPVATLSEEDFDTIESFYEQKDKTNIMDFALFLDAKLLEKSLAVVAF